MNTSIIIILTGVTREPLLQQRQWVAHSNVTLTTMCIFVVVYIAGMIYSGMGPDFRVLVRKGRKKAQAYFRKYKEPIPVLQLTRQIAGIMQEFTQVAHHFACGHVGVEALVCSHVQALGVYVCVLHNSLVACVRSACLSWWLAVMRMDHSCIRCVVPPLLAPYLQYKQQSSDCYAFPSRSLRQVDPSGSYFGWRASAIGKNYRNAKTFLEKVSAGQYAY